MSLLIARRFRLVARFFSFAAAMAGPVVGGRRGLVPARLLFPETAQIDEFLAHARTRSKGSLSSHSERQRATVAGAVKLRKRSAIWARKVRSAAPAVSSAAPFAATAGRVAAHLQLQVVVRSQVNRRMSFNHGRRAAPRSAGIAAR